MILIFQSHCRGLMASVSDRFTQSALYEYIMFKFNICVFHSSNGLILNKDAKHKTFHTQYGGTTKFHLHSCTVRGTQYGGTIHCILSLKQRDHRTPHASVTSTVSTMPRIHRSKEWKFHSCSIVSERSSCRRQAPTLPGSYCSGRCQQKRETIDSTFGNKS